MGYSDRVERKFLRKARKFCHPFLQWEQELQEIAKTNCLQATVEGHLFTKTRESPNTSTVCTT